MSTESSLSAKLICHIVIYQSATRSFLSMTTPWTHLHSWPLLFAALIRLADCTVLFFILTAAESVTITISSNRENAVTFFFLFSSYPSFGACWLVHHWFWWPFSNREADCSMLAGENSLSLSPFLQAVGQAYSSRHQYWALFHLLH